ncbi:MAG: hypothetical protein GY811_05300 [Myxococcales bacterium]|nr:hypothetical protein [Myxococcales bacterium]
MRAPDSSDSDTSLGSDQRGAIFIEFLFVLLPFLVLLFGLAQTALMYMGGLAVQRSAATAARAAIVVLDDDPAFYGRQPRNQIGGQRGRAIELAASFPLYALKSSPQFSDTLEASLRASRSSPYITPANIAPGLTVSFPGGVSSSRGGSITVRVDYEFSCEVPVVRALMCDGGTISMAAESTLPNHAANYNYGSWN